MNTKSLFVLLNGLVNLRENLASLLTVEFLFQAL
jgi:hypothetical protein